MLKYKKVLVDDEGFYVSSYSPDYYGFFEVTGWTPNKNYAFDFDTAPEHVVEELLTDKTLHEEKVLMLEDTLTDKEKEQLDKTMKRVLNV